MKKYIIVTGASFTNKGIQAMTYITADEIAKRWPDCQMLIESRKVRKTEKEEMHYYKFGLFPGVEKFLFPVHPKKYHEIMSNTEALIDISGYNAGSDWSEKSNIYYIKTRLIDPKIYNIPVYLMPQSFGPFGFQGIIGKIIMLAFEHYLPYAKLIMARENDGKQRLIEAFGLKNVIKENDLVLQNKGIIVENVFRNNHVLKVPEVASHKCVAVIPNVKNERNRKINDMMKIYQLLINKLMHAGFKVYILHHSPEDAGMCKHIKERFFNDEERVEVISQELDCLEFDVFVSKMDFIVASRYHAIVHAFRRHVPALVIGWAVKYYELLKLAGQEPYHFDSREPIKEEAVCNALEKMIINYKSESEKIRKAVDEVQKENVFDYIKLKRELTEK